MAVKKSATEVAKKTRNSAQAAAGEPVAKTAGKAAATKSPAASKPVAKPAPQPAPVNKVAAKKKVNSTIDSKTITKKAASKTAKPAKTASAEKPVVKKAAAAAKKAPAKKAVAKTATPAKPAVAKSAPVKKAAAKKASKTSPKTTAAASGTGKPSAAVKSPASPPAPVKRKIGKVAVAVVGKPQAPVVRSKVKVVPYKTEKNTGRPILPKDYEPSAEEEYMSPLQLEYFRQRLMTWRDDLVEESKQTIENLKEEVRDVGDEAERATRETENSLELRTRDRYRKLISKIDSTIKRVDTGDYGFCVDSGEEIGLERLDARLTAERTIDAQERWEHLRKQMGD